MGLCVLHCTHHARGAQRGCMASSPAEPGCASLARFGLPHAKLGAPVSMGEGEEGRGGSGTVVGAGSGYTRRAVSTPYMDCRSMRATRRPSSSALNSSTWERGGGGQQGVRSWAAGTGGGPKHKRQGWACHRVGTCPAARNPAVCSCPNAGVRGDAAGAADTHLRRCIQHAARHAGIHAPHAAVALAVHAAHLQGRA